MALELIHTDFENYAEIIANPNFPEDLKNRIAAVEQMMVDYEQEPTPDLAQKIKSLSATLWHKIKDFTEAELPEYEENLAPPVQAEGETQSEYSRRLLRNKRQ
jgi:hypothetical protein